MIFKYRDSSGKSYSLDEAMRASKVFLVLCTRNYLNDLKNLDSRLYLEFKAAKELRIPTVLLLFEDLTEEEKIEAKELFRGHKVLKVFESVPKNLGSWKEYDKLKRLLKQMCKSNY